MTFSRLFKYFIIVTVIASLVACQTTRRTLKFDTSAEINFKALENINPDDDGRPSPVVVRVFKLTDSRQFSREDFLNLYENADDRLGKDLIDTIILKELAPGELRTETLELSTDVKYIGLLAEFVRYQDADAIVLLPITDHKKNSFDVTLDRTDMLSGDYPMKKTSQTSSSDKSDDDSGLDMDDARKAQKDKSTVEKELDSF
ncbi:type VI secretion system lipoprotein TssJ [Agaribacterium sp. ZY112]|uniref:type VI secretion system lipoprotein TssJ n=1 Tax=Agaribacterium sp. ZY112 TaxID=3233574 RepID=UPI00352668F8